MEHFVRVYDDVLSAAFCEEIVERFEADESKFAGLCIGPDDRPEVNPAHKTTTELVISGQAAWRDVEEQLTHEYFACSNRYAQEFSDLSSISRRLSSEDFRIKKYEVDGFFDWHIDCAGQEYHRLLAVQFYFNDVAEGGETQFQYQDVRVKPVQGRVVIFPTLWTYRHRSSKAISNPKYICTNYVRCHPEP